jgi:hypothetical protein
VRIRGYFSKPKGFREQKSSGNAAIDSVAVWRLMSLAAIPSAACCINFMQINITFCLHTDIFVVPVLVCCS